MANDDVLAASAPFTTVGIGASAGGLAALEFKPAREEARSVREAVQASRDALKSINEELRSTNEELQIAHLQWQTKVTGLSHASNDMKNPLNRTEVATPFPDEMRHVRRFSARATCAIKLISRPISDILTDLNRPGMAQVGREVLLEHTQPQAVGDGLS